MKRFIENFRNVVYILYVYFYVVYYFKYRDTRAISSIDLVRKNSVCFKRNIVQNSSIYCVLNTLLTTYVTQNSF